MTLSAEDVETIKNLIVDPLSRQIDGIHKAGSCSEIIAIHKKVDSLSGQQKYIFGIFTAILFMATFFRDAIVGFFTR